VHLKKGLGRALPQEIWYFLVRSRTRGPKRASATFSRFHLRGLPAPKIARTLMCIKDAFRGYSVLTWHWVAGGLVVLFEGCLWQYGSLHDCSVRYGSKYWPFGFGFLGRVPALLEHRLTRARRAGQTRRSWFAPPHRHDHRVFGTSIILPPRPRWVAGCFPGLFFPRAIRRRLLQGSFAGPSRCAFFAAFPWDRHCSGTIFWRIAFGRRQTRWVTAGWTMWNPTVCIRFVAGT